MASGRSEVFRLVSDRDIASVEGYAVQMGGAFQTVGVHQIMYLSGYGIGEIVQILPVIALALELHQHVGKIRTATLQKDVAVSLPC